jgi:hypothetical protein
VDANWRLTLMHRMMQGKASFRMVLVTKYGMTQTA